MLQTPTLQVQAEANLPGTFRHVVISGDGKLLAAVCGGSLYLLDAFNGSLKARFSTGRPEGAPGYEPSFSPDSQYLSSGDTFACCSTLPAVEWQCVPC